MAWNIEMTEEYEQWLDGLEKDERTSVIATIILLKEKGPLLPRPYADKLKGSTIHNMKELRTQHDGKPYRSLYVFNPKRTGILLIGGCKEGDDRWYQTHIPIAEKLYQKHLESL